MSVMFSKIYDHDVSILDLIQDNDVVAISDFHMATTSEYLINQLYSRYQRLGHPNNISVVSDTLPAVPGRTLDYIAKQLCEDEDQRFLRGY